MTEVVAGIPWSIRNRAWGELLRSELRDAYKAYVSGLRLAQDTLFGGQWLSLGEGRKSLNGRTFFTLQTDGNLVIYDLYTGGALRAWGIIQGTSRAIMQTDGNFVLYRAGVVPRWASDTTGNPGAILKVQDDGNVVVYQGSVALWSSETSGYKAYDGRSWFQKTFGGRVDVHIELNFGVDKGPVDTVSPVDASSDGSADASSDGSADVATADPSDPRTPWLEGALAQNDSTVTDDPNRVASDGTYASGSFESGGTDIGAASSTGDPNEVPGYDGATWTRDDNGDYITPDGTERWHYYPGDGNWVGSPVTPPAPPDSPWNDFRPIDVPGSSGTPGSDSGPSGGPLGVGPTSGAAFQYKNPYGGIYTINPVLGKSQPNPQDTQPGQSPGASSWDRAEDIKRQLGVPPEYTRTFWMPVGGPVGYRKDPYTGMNDPIFDPFPPSAFFAKGRDPLESAAYFALAFVLQAAVENNVEIGGGIYKFKTKDAKGKIVDAYRLGRVYVGNPHNLDGIYPLLLKSEEYNEPVATLAGIYHVHIGDPAPSRGDRDVASEINGPGYISDYNGFVTKYFGEAAPIPVGNLPLVQNDLSLQVKRGIESGNPKKGGKP